MDADNSTTLEQIDNFWPWFDRGFDVVIGSRALKDSVIGTHQSRIKEITGRFGNWFIQKLAAPGIRPKSLDLSEFDLLPHVDWATGMRESWRPGEEGALAELKRFLAEALPTYPSDRDRPDRMGTSRLSPHRSRLCPRHRRSKNTNPT